ncbi:MAG: DNA cytosine methyltransferase [Pseudomonadota bacterium]
MKNFYNENDPKAAAWLRELVSAGEIPHGDVDERDIRDITPDNLRGYTQCHFFAGIGGWPLALKLAGWPEDRPVWTGSCPCQPFSAAGQGKGFDDKRHLWPFWLHLIRVCRPSSIFGEQVASKAGLGWYDLVSSDLEGEGYALGEADLCAAGGGAPHIRQRLFFGAYDTRHANERLANVASRDARPEWKQRGREHGQQPEDRGFGGIHDSPSSRQQPEGEGAESEAWNETRLRGPERGRRPSGLEHGQIDGRIERGAEPSGRSAVSGRGAERMANGNDAGSQGRIKRRGSAGEQPSGQSGLERERHPRPTDGFWRDADWLFCRDGRWRPVEPGTFPLAHGVSGRVGLLRGYGNAIVPQVAEVFIEEFEEAAREVQS